MYHAVVATVLQVQSSLCRECATPTSFLLVIGALHGRRRHRLPPLATTCPRLSCHAVQFELLVHVLALTLSSVLPDSLGATVFERSFVICRVSMAR